MRRLSLTIMVLLLLRGAYVLAEGPAVRFRMHTINASARHEPCSVFDVNRDGRLDIFSGSFWYEAPSWKRHHAWDIREQDNYYYDFSNLPIDVNGDGWIDAVTVAWHNETVSWIENPGRRGGSWSQHFIDKPGHLETALMADLDADGDPDVLPNVMEQVIWYEFTPVKGSPPATKPGDPCPYFRPRPVGKEGAGAGIGTGDINGDKRVDILCAKGWYEGPKDPRKDKWIWHGEWDLGDAGIPILAYDVDGDGDTDLVWGIGHNYGVYWLEQGRDAADKRVWSKHLIDKSWSQAHNWAAADIDNDGELEAITGKRYHAHNGADPGEEEPLCIYAYDFDRKARKWSRHVISERGRAGFGISGWVVDIDNDGDIDVVAAGKSGLYLFENLLRSR